MTRITQPWQLSLQFQGTQMQAGNWGTWLWRPSSNSTPRQGTGWRVQPLTVGPAAQFLPLQCPRLQPLTQSSSAREPNNPSCSRSIHSPLDPSLPPPPQQLPATQGTPDMVEVPIIPGFPAVTPAAKHQQPQGHTQRQRRRQATPLTERQQRRQSAHSLMEPEAPQVRETQNLRYTATY